MGHLYYALNALIISVNATQLQAISTESGVSQVGVIADSQVAADPTVDNLVGATQAQQTNGLLGDGRVVAVLDTGIDFTHSDLFGTGNVADYNTCYAQNTVAPTGICAQYFGPTAPKVIGGYDFVGDTWPNTSSLAPDPNPIAKAVTGGHGTHVSDIIAGTKGIAPHAKIVAVKVCSAVSSACSGDAILEGLDFVGQWNSDPANASRKIDVVNMSLGQGYGTKQDPDAAAVENLVQSGVVVAVAAGNDGNKPYVVSSPSIAPGAISVAQFAMPSDFLYPISVTTGGTTTLIKYSILQPWGPSLSSVITGPVQYGAAGDLLGCNGFAAGAFSGKIAFLDRGTCSVSVKVSNAAAAGAKAVIIGLVAPGDPFSFGFGGGTPTVPSFVISQASANLIRNATGAVNATIDPAAAIPLVESAVGSSARGPSSSYQTIKPEIGAPGASISAEAGTGSGETAFGGTSGATPVISGSALLVGQKYPTLGPLDIKTLLMNTAHTGINGVDSNGNLYTASTDRVGAGEVRVNQAVTTQTSVSVVGTESAALSFGYYTVALNPQIVQQTIRIKNMTNQGRLYVISASYRDPSEASSGAVVFQSGFPRNAWVNANSTADVVVQMMITGPKLNAWTLNASATGDDGTTLDPFTYDGYIKVDGGTPQNVVTLPWHTLPHKAADTQVNSTFNTVVNGKQTKVIQFANSIGALPGTVETFQLLGTRASSGAQPGVGANFALIDLKAFGVRDDGTNLQFGVDTYEQQASPIYPAEYDVYIDTTGGQNPNFVLFNAECGLSFAADGRDCSFLVNLTTGAETQLGFTDASYNSGLLIQTVPLAALGISSGQQISTFVNGADNYYTGNVTSTIPADGSFATYTVGHPRFALQALPWAPFPAGSNGTTFSVSNNGFQVGTTVGASSLSNASGLLFLYRDALRPTREVETVTLP